MSGIIEQQQLTALEPGHPKLALSVHGLKTLLEIE